jgi:L-lactate utilization protein LutB
MSAEETTVGKYVVRLSDEERAHLLGLLHKGKHPARKLMRARVLLKAAVSESLPSGLTRGW